MSYNSQAYRYAEALEKVASAPDSMLGHLHTMLRDLDRNSTVSSLTNGATSGFDKVKNIASGLAPAALTSALVGGGLGALSGYATKDEYGNRKTLKHGLIGAGLGGLAGVGAKAYNAAENTRKDLLDEVIPKQTLHKLTPFLFSEETKKNLANQQQQAEQPWYKFFR